MRSPFFGIARMVECHRTVEGKLDVYAQSMRYTNLQFSEATLIASMLCLWTLRCHFSCVRANDMRRKVMSTVWWLSSLLRIATCAL
jgi:hypothetical protein